MRVYIWTVDASSSISLFGSIFAIMLREVKWVSDERMIKRRCERRSVKGVSISRCCQRWHIVQLLFLNAAFRITLNIIYETVSDIQKNYRRVG